MKVSDYITQFLLSKDVTKVFSVTGGFAMHLNDSFGQNMDVTYTHGESPAGYAALGWSSVDHLPSVCCVTSGCGATNAITPCLISYQDSVPIFFISGQVQKDVNIRSRGGTIRGYFGSDCDIIESVKSMTKFSYELRDPSETRRILEECWYNLTTGRLGPVWLSIPVDVQSMDVPEVQDSFIEPNIEQNGKLPDEFYKIWSQSKRPIVLAGNGIHQSGTLKEFKSFLKKHSIPYVVSFFGSDLGDDYIGKVGIIGDRAGNFAIQNADFVLCLGCRLSKTITGYKRELFAREAKVVCLDIDESENIIDKKIDLFINMDLRCFFSMKIETPIQCPTWTKKLLEWKENWTYELPPNDTDILCPYDFLNKFFTNKQGNTNIVASSGSLFCVQWHMYKHKECDKYIPSSHGDMGFEIPVSIGASMNNLKRTFCLVGDGAFQYSIQDLQTLKHNNSPVTVMVFNNGGYGAIQITQNAVFKREFGTTSNSNISFCDIEKVSKSYDLPYYKVSNRDDLGFLDVKQGPIIVEVVCKVTERYPKISNQLQPDGSFKNMPHEQMYPFLSEEELSDNLFIKSID